MEGSGKEFFCCDGGLQDGGGEPIALLLDIEENTTFRYFFYVDSMAAAPNLQKKIEIAMVGSGAAVEVYVLLFASGQRHISLDISLRHCASNTHSTCIIRAIGEDRSLLSIRARIAVDRGALCCSSTMENKNLRLSPEARVEAVPILDIGAPDARCSHGTTVGGPDAQQLFYLQSRGLDGEMAKKLLCDAFASELLKKFPSHFHGAEKTN
jgi:Fe-S cluster assembly protein SufD